jgi:protein-tyrosine phosphatase
MSKTLPDMDVLRSLTWDQRVVYTTLKIKRALGTRRDEVLIRERAIRNVVFVCHGNIIRSPLADHYFRKLLSERGAVGLTSTSAGLYVSAGRRADPRAVRVAAAGGLSLEGHTARPLLPQVVERADLICVMDDFTESVAVARYPDAEKKVVLLGAFGRGPEDPIVITDPYRGPEDATDACFARVRAAVEGLWAALVTGAR